MEDLSKIGRVTCYLAIAITGAVTIAIILLLFHLWLFLMLPGSAARGMQYMEIAPGTSSLAIAEMLHERGIVSDSKIFYLLVLYRQLGHKLKAGEYAFVCPSTPGRIMDQLVSGRVVIHRATFPEGVTIRDVARILYRQGLASEDDILRLARNRDFITQLGLNAPSLEGYLFPETYTFQKRQDGSAMLKAMVHQFWRHFPDEWKKRAEELGMGVLEVTTLASMVEKEAVVDWERPIIAAVFMNRLKRNMPLQSDPTAVYDLADFSGAITSAHLKRQSPYNTYVIKGLPPGPICNPGSKSIKAVLYPENVSYLYFVSNTDGTHYFSETFPEHSEAVSRYREKRKALQEEGGPPQPTGTTDPPVEGHVSQEEK